VRAPCEMRHTMTTSYGFIGVGKIGSAFGIRLAERGYQVVACRDMKPEEAAHFAGAVSGCRIMPTSQSLADECDFVFITTPDDSIAEVAAAVRWRGHQTVVHCSGANTVGVLEPVKHALHRPTLQGTRRSHHSHSACQGRAVARQGEGSKRTTGGRIA
jgi:predicted short-subunit dehydrogenase-like oxidoreductase (DUF2520 family)